MAIKHDILGLLIYLTMAAYLAGLVAAAVARLRQGRRTLSRPPSRAARLADVFLLAGFLAAAVAFVLRWITVSHLPLQNLFEIFLCLGMIIVPLSLFCRRFLGINQTVADALLGLVILFPAGFVFSDQPQKLPPSLQSLLFAPHVGTYMLAYVILFKAGLCALPNLAKRNDAAADLPAATPALDPIGDLRPGLAPRDVQTDRLIRLGFGFLTVGLFLGAVWGKIAWGDYWNWDPKELWSLATWLIYVAYFHHRALTGRRNPRASAAFATVGALGIVITLLWVNLSIRFPGMHNYATP